MGRGIQNRTISQALPPKKLQHCLYLPKQNVAEWTELSESSLEMICSPAAAAPSLLSHLFSGAGSRARKAWWLPRAALPSDVVLEHRLEDVTHCARASTACPSSSTWPIPAVSFLQLRPWTLLVLGNCRERDQGSQYRSSLPVAASSSISLVAFRDQRQQCFLR